MQKVKQIFIVLILLSTKTYVYCQTTSSDSLAYEIAKSDSLAREIAKSKFQIDTSFTGFTLANIFEDNFIYTPNGTIDLHSDYETSGFAIMTLPDIPYEKGIELIQYLESTIKQDGSIINNMKKMDTLINGNKIHERTFELIDKSNKIKFIYLAFLKKENSAIGFMGTDMAKGKYLTPFKKTFRNIKF